MQNHFTHYYNFRFSKKFISKSNFVSVFSFAEKADEAMKYMWHFFFVWLNLSESLLSLLSSQMVVS